MTASKKNVIVVRYRETSNSWRTTIDFWAGALWTNDWLIALRMTEQDALKTRASFRLSALGALTDTFDAIEDYGLVSERTLS